MKIKELKQIISKVPDDADVVIWVFRQCDIRRLNIDPDKKWMRYQKEYNTFSIDAMIECGRDRYKFQKQFDNSKNQEVEHIR